MPTPDEGESDNYIYLPLVVGDWPHAQASVPYQGAPTSGLSSTSGLVSKSIGAFHIGYETEFSQVATDYQMNASLNGFVDPMYALDLLASAQALGFEVAGTLGTAADYQSSTGKFSLRRFQQKIDGFAEHYNDFAPYIADGTLYAHVMFDEPCDAEKWGGKAIPRELIKAASDYSKEKLPGLATSVGMGNCMDILQPGDLDLPLAPWSQRPDKGPVDVYIAEQIAALEGNDFVDPEILLSLNVMTGGTLPPEQVASDAIYACQHPDVAMVLWWEWHGEEDFAAVVNGDLAYQDAVRAGTAACAGSAQISGMVYNDVDGDGALGADDTPLVGVTVDLSDGQSTTSDDSGGYEFLDLSPGDYLITETDPSGYVSVTDVDGGHPNVISLTLVAGGHRAGLYFLDRLAFDIHLPLIFRN